MVTVVVLLSVSLGLEQVIMNIGQERIPILEEAIHGVGVR